MKGRPNEHELFTMLKKILDPEYDEQTGVPRPQNSIADLTQNELRELNSIIKDKREERFNKNVDQLIDILGTNMTELRAVKKDYERSTAAATDGSSTNAGVGINQQRGELPLNEEDFTEISNAISDLMLKGL